VISFGLTTAAAAIPAAALTPEGTGAIGAESAPDFGNVLQQLMGGAPGGRPATDLPFDLDEPATTAGQTEDDVDELVNAIGVDLAAPPVLRLVATTPWAISDPAPAPAPAAEAGAADVPMADRPTSVGFPIAIAVPIAVSDRASKPFAALAAADETPAVKPPPANLPAVDLPPVNLPDVDLPKVDLRSVARPVPAMADAEDTITAVPTGTAGPAPTAPAAKMPTVAVTPAPTPGAVSPAPTPDPHVALPAQVAAPPTPASAAPAALEVSPSATATPRSADKVDAARQTFRVTADAGQRAYAAAAASDAPSKDTQQGFGEARREFGTGREPVGAAPSATSGAPVAQPFHVVVDRPAPPAGFTLATPVAVPPEAVEATVARELPAQVVQSIRMRAVDGGGEAIVRLRPDYLGELVVAVKVENGAVIAALQSDTPAVRKWIESNEASLRQALAEHGLQLDRLTVSDEAPQTEADERGPQERDQEEAPQPQSRRQRKPAPDATFEVVV